VSEIHDRIKETLALIADEAQQRRYQAQVPAVSVPAQLFSWWDDWYHPTSAGFRAGFDAGELLALEHFAGVVDEVSDETPDELPPLEEFIASAPAKKLAAAARVALASLHGTR
jgi:hypothetical protein